MISRVYSSNTKEQEGIFFDYQVCTADGLAVDVWFGEIKKLEDVKEV